MYQYDEEGRVTYCQIVGESEGVRELAIAVPQYCQANDYIFFLFRDSGFYMRTPSVSDSMGFLPMLRVLRNPKYNHYDEVHQLMASEAKDILRTFSHWASRGKTRRFAMREAVRKASVCSAARNAFNLADDFETYLDQAARKFSLTGLSEDDILSMTKGVVAKEMQEDIEQTLKKALLRFFPSELFEDIDETILASEDIHARGVFLRNNSTDHTD